jgi:hypothetical protein
MSQEVEKEKQLCLGKYNSIKKKLKIWEDQEK